jgi:Zn-dependent protease with chaperone function
MALPSGVIIFTDDLVELAENDDELVAILGHEIGHIAHRHSLRSIVQSSLALWLIVAVTGDISAASEMTATVPALLADLAYSRDMETEADDYALAFMQEHGLDPDHFAAIMTRLEASHGNPETSTEEDDDDLGFLSTHPPTPERIERFKDVR